MACAKRNRKRLLLSISIQVKKTHDPFESGARVEVKAVLVERDKAKRRQARLRRARSLRGFPGAQDLEDLDQLAQVVGVVVGQEEDFAEEGLAGAAGDGGFEIGLGVEDEFLHGFAAGFEIADAFLPGGCGGRG